MDHKKTVIYAGILMHLLAAYFSVGHFHVDEHFQILEFAGYKCGITPPGDLAWEFSGAIRPAMQPFVAYLLYQALNLFGSVNPFIWAMLLRLLAAGLALWAARTTFRTFIKGNSEKAELIFWCLSLLFWCMPYNHVRFSSENLSGILMLFAVSLYPYKDAAPKRIMVAGLCAGFALVCRYQAAFSLAGMGLWLLFIHRIGFRQVLLFVLPVFTALLAGVLIDYWFYGKWVFTLWNYFEVNIVENKAAEFGIEPWWYYITEMVAKLFIPFGLICIAALTALVFRRPKELVLWLILPFLAGHMLVGHKELRFMFPLLHFVPLLVTMAYLHFSATVSGWLSFRTVRYMTLLLAIINMLMLLPVSLQPASKRVALLEHLYDKPVNNTVCLNQNPYKDQLWLRVYMPDTTVKTWPVLPDTMRVNAAMVIVPEYAWHKSPQYYSRTYAQVPPLAEYVNVNNWMARTEFWSVYIKQSSRSDREIRPSP